MSLYHVEINSVTFVEETPPPPNFWRDAWFPVGLCAIGLAGLLVGAITTYGPPVYRAIVAALEP